MAYVTIKCIMQMHLQPISVSIRRQVAIGADQQIDGHLGLEDSWMAGIID